MYPAFFCLWIAGLLYRQEESETGEEVKEGWNRNRCNVYDRITSAGVFYSKVNSFFSNNKSPSSRILHNSFDMALRSTQRKSASCCLVKGIVKWLLLCRLASSDRYDRSFARVVAASNMLPRRRCRRAVSLFRGGW